MARISYADSATITDPQITRWLKTLPAKQGELGAFLKEKTKKPPIRSSSKSKSINHGEHREHRERKT